MRGIGIHSEFASGNTLVSNIFIDKYMNQASGEFVKVYLMLLRCMGARASEITISGLADALDNTEKDVLRALRCFEKMDILKLEFDGEELTDIILYDLNQMGNHEHLENRECLHRESHPEMDRPSIQETKAADIDIQAVRYEYEEPDMHEKNEVIHQNQDWVDYEYPEVVATVAEPQGDTIEEDDEEFRQLMFVIEQYIGKPLKQTDCDMFAYLYKDLSMSSSLLEYLVDYCVTNKHNNIRYMESVALDWHEHHIQTLEQAKRYVPVSKKDMYTVMKALGLGGRQPAPAETKWLDKWFIDDGFCLELILEACNRTISSIHSPSFRYADKILENWKANGVKQIGDIQSLDEQHQSNQQNMIAVTTTTVKHRLSGKSSKPNKFHNFDQRDYDYDALLHHLNGTAQ